MDLLTTSDAERLLVRSRATYYEHGDKPSRLLSHQLKRQTTSRLIPQIKDSSGALVSDPTSINDIFRDFYFSLYESESSSDTTEMTSFIQNLDIPKVDPTTANELDAPLNLEVIKSTIKAMQNNKTPVPMDSQLNFLRNVLISWLLSSPRRKKSIL